MLKTAPRSLLPAALLSVLVGLAGCHISIGSGGSSSRSPDGVRGKPAYHSPSKSARTSTSSKPIQKKSTKPASADDSGPTRDAADDKTTDEGPHRDKPAASDPTRTKTSGDPQRTKPASDPVRTPKHIGDTGNDGDDDPVRTPKHVGSNAGGSGGEAGDEDAGAAGANLVAPSKGSGGAKEIVRPGSVAAPQ